MKLQMPWDYIEGRNEPEPGFTTPNEPTPEGAELGGYLAHFADREYCETGRDTRCEDCAFRLGTRANQSAVTLMNAVKCLAEREPFDCHVHEQVCGGYAMLIRSTQGEG